MLDAGKRAERLGDRVVAEASRASSSHSRGRVLAVVLARNAGLSRQRVVRGELNATTSSGNGIEAARHDGHVGVRLAFEHAELRIAVGTERAVAVDVIRLQVEQDCDPRLQRLDILELERRQLTEDPGVVGDAPDKRRERPTDVAGNLRRPSGGVEHRSEQRGRRRLPVRAGDPDQRVREESRAQLDLAQNWNATRPRAHHQRAITRDAWALDHGVDSPEQRVVLLSEVDFDGRRDEPPHHLCSECAITVVADDLDALRTKRERRRLARPREPEHERPLHSRKRR